MHTHRRAACHLIGFQQRADDVKTAAQHARRVDDLDAGRCTGAVGDRVVDRVGGRVGGPGQGGGENRAVGADY